MVSKYRDSVSGYNVDNTRKLQKYKVRPHLHLQLSNTSPTLPPQLTQDLSWLLSALLYRWAYGREMYLCGLNSIIELCSRLPNVVNSRILAQTGYCCLQKLLENFRDQ